MENQGKISDYVVSHCAHHWVIAVPNGPISEGVCQRCGDHREFQIPRPRFAGLPIPKQVKELVVRLLIARSKSHGSAS